MITHIQILTEDNAGNGPIIYDGEFGDMDFINRDVIIGELLENIFKTANECDITKENLKAIADKGQKVVIKYWKENKLLI